VLRSIRAVRWRSGVVSPVAVRAGGGKPSYPTRRLADSPPLAPYYCADHHGMSTARKIVDKTCRSFVYFVLATGTASRSVDDIRCFEERKV